MSAVDPLAADLEQKGLAGGAGVADPLEADLRRKEKYAATMAKVAALKAAPNPMSAGELVKESGKEIWSRLKTMGSGVAALGRSALHPVDTATTPEKRRELLRGVGDTVTLGYGQDLADKATSLLPESLQHGTTGQEPASLRETEAADAEAAPGYRAGGQLAGTFMPGATSAIGGAAGRAAGAATKNPLLRAALGYELASPASAALHAGAAGHRLEAAADAAMDPTGLALSVGGAAVGQAVGNKIKKSRGYQARKFIEQEGGGATVGPTSAGAGGAFDKELAGVAPNDQGIGVAAKTGSRAILKGIKDEHRIETSEPYRKLKAQIDSSPAASQPRDVAPILENLKAATNDLGTDDAVVSKLRNKIDQLESFRQPPDPQQVAGATRAWWKLKPAERQQVPLEQYLAKNAQGPVMVPESQLNGLRRSLMRAAKIGTTDAPGEKEAPLRAAAFLAKQMVDEGPYAELNDLYAKGAAKLEGQRRQLGLKPKAGKDAGVDVRKLKLTLEREGQNTKTAGGDSDIAGFREQNPALRRATNLAELARARADLTFRTSGPQHGGLLERMNHPSGSTVAGALGGAALAHPAAAGAGAGAYLLRQNATPIAGRYLAPFADSGPINPLVWAAQKQRQRETELATQLQAP